MQDFMLREVFETLIVVAGIVLVAYSPIFRALGNRLMHGRTPAPGTAQVADDERVDQLSGEMAALRRELDATHERLDFTERMLAQSRERGVLPAPRNG
jgi:hypothetical protein